MNGRIRNAAAAVVVVLAAVVAAPPASARGQVATYRAEIRRTDFGVPHIEARDYGGLGAGVGYASAEDNFCELAERIVTVNGERARHLGAGDKDANIVSDAYHKALLRSGEVERLLGGPPGALDTPSRDARALVQGFVAGVNEWLRVTGAAKIPDERCRGAAWVRGIREIDMWRVVFAGQMPFQMAGIVGAAPPAARPGVPTAAVLPVRDDPLPLSQGLGSNAIAAGKDAVRIGRSALLANPHYPWDGPNRFYRLHLMIPGKLNVVGAGLMNVPVVGIGHNAEVAWTHTVSTARRFGYFELTLDPADPTRYRYEGGYEPMQRIVVPVEVRVGDALRTVERTLYRSRYGFVLATESLPWSAERAFALALPPLGLRLVDQYLAVWQVRSVEQLRTALGRFQGTGFNTTAVDSGGKVFYGDMGMIPHVTAAEAAECSISELARRMWRSQRIPVLDGSRAACAWGRDADSSAPGVFGPAAAPQLLNTTYATQSNDSYWLTNPDQPIEGLSPIFGDERTARSLRTRLGLDIVARRLAGTDGLPGRGFDSDNLLLSLVGNRHFGAELVRDDLVALCRTSGKPGLAAACEVLARWDLKVDLDSRGAHLFHLFAEADGLHFKVPFDAAHPSTTPNTLDTADPRVLAALEKAVAQAAQLRLPLDAPLGTVQAEMRGAERIPIHGGAGPEGVFNNILVDALEPGRGWTSVRHGTSFVMAVEFTAEGPQSRGLLAYSQSTDPGSAHYADQTRAYSEKRWDPLRFQRAAVVASTLSKRTLRIRVADAAQGR